MTFTLTSTNSTPEPGSGTPQPSAAQKFRTAHGDPADWSPEDWSVYLDLGGVQ